MSASREKKSRQSDPTQGLTQKERKELQEQQAAKRKAVVYTVIGVIVAVLVAAAKAGVTKEALLQQYTVIGENPFDAARKRMSVTVSGPGGVRLLCKGAPDMLLARCTHIETPAGPRLLAPRDRADINAACARMAGEALRVLDGVEGIAQCFLTEKDVVRHELVQRIVKAYAEYENKKGKGKPAAKPAGKRLPTRRKEGK